MQFIDTTNFESESRGSDAVDLSAFASGAVLDLRNTESTQSVIAGQLTLIFLGSFENIEGTGGDDTLTGTAQPNRLDGRGGNDTLLGLAGDDVLIGGTGNDTLDGSTGDDQYLFETELGVSLGNDRIYEDANSGTDLIDFSGLPTGLGSFDMNISSAQVLAGGLANLTVRKSGMDASLGELEDVRGTSGNDMIVGNALDNRFELLSGNDSVDGGSGSDIYVFRGHGLGSDTITDSSGGAGRDTLDFLGFDAPISLNLAVTTPQIQSNELTLKLASGDSIENVVGTSFNDTILGNSLNNAIYGAAGSDTLNGRAGNDTLFAGLPAVVLLDFDSGYNAARGDYNYSVAERNTIQQRIEADYAKFDWKFTQIQSVARDWTTDSGRSFATLAISQGRGGEVSGDAGEVDFRNINRRIVTEVNINSLKSAIAELLGPNYTQIEYSEKIVALTSTIASHELGHTAGLRHGDAFGPMGSGVYVNTDTSRIYPIYAGLLNASETSWHLLASPASVGTSIADAARDLFFGERESIKLAFNEIGQARNEVAANAGSHATPATAEDLSSLAQLVVPNMLPATGFANSGKEFDVSAMTVVGELKTTNAANSTEIDYYKFTGMAGEIVNVELLANSIQPLRGDAFDGALAINKSDGTLLAENDDDFEGTKDATLLDVVLPANGTYFIAVSRSIVPSLPAPGGRYELFVSRFRALTGGTVLPSTTGDTLIGGAGSDTVQGGMADDFFSAADSLATDAADTLFGGAGLDTLDAMGLDYHFNASSIETIMGLPGTGQVTITVTTNEDTQLILSQSDLKGSTNAMLSVISVSGATNGNVSLNLNGTVTFTPELNFNGTAGFDYVLSDGSLTRLGHATIIIVAVNDAPVAVDDTVTTNEDTPLTMTQTDLKGNDTDVDNTNAMLSVISVSGATRGNVSLNLDGTVTFTPELNFNGTAGFDYTLSDGNLTSIGHVTINVLAVNDPPVGVPTITGAATEDQVLTVVTSGISDADGLGTFTYQWQRATNAAFTAGVTTVGTNSTTYTLGDADVGNYIRVRVTYTDGNATAEGPLVSTTVGPIVNVNDPPTLTTFAAVIDTTDEDTQVELTFAELTAQGNEADVDGTVVAFIVQAVSSGTLKIGANAGVALPFAAETNNTINASTNAYWTPALNANGTRNAFTVLAKDDLGALSTGAVTAQVQVVPAAIYNFTVATFAANEGNATNTTNVVTVTRSVNITGATSVQVSLASGMTNGATASTDFTAGPITVSFVNGETSKTVPIEFLGDTTVELNETIALTLTNASGNGNIGTTNPTSILTILNDDVDLAIAANQASKLEGHSGNTQFTFTVTRTGNLTGTTTATYTVSGTGGNPAMVADFGGSFPTGTVTFLPNATSQVVTINVIGDRTVELNEDFLVTLSVPSDTFATNAVDLAVVTAASTITNDDSAVISISNPSVAEGGTLAFNVTINNPVDVAVTADRATADGTTNPAVANNDYTALASANVTLFAAGSTTTLTVNVSTTSDTNVELNEQMRLILSNLTAGGRSVSFLGSGSTLAGTGTITDNDTSTTVAASTVQYSDTVVLSASINTGIAAIVSGTLAFSIYVGSSWVQYASATVTNQATPARVNVTTSQVLLAPGNYSYEAVFTSSDSAYTGSSGTNTITVNQENANVVYTGATYLNTSSVNSTTLTVPLEALIRDISVVNPADTNPGDIRNATVTFTVYDAFTNSQIGSPITAVLGLVSASDLHIALAQASFMANIGSAAAATYRVHTIVSNYYAADNTSDDSLITVSKPLDNSVSGGGYIITKPGASAGQYKADDSSRMNFGISITYNKNQTNVQGKVNIIFRRTEGGVPKVYQIKSTASDALGVDPVTGIATFNAKANLTDVTNSALPMTIGNFDLVLNVDDNGEPGTGSNNKGNDQIAVRLTDGALLKFASNWNLGQAVLQTLDGGNIQVRPYSETLLSVSDVSVTEGNSGLKNATFTVSLNVATNNTVTFTYGTIAGTATAGATATAGVDYLTKTGTGTILAGQLSTTILVSVVGDTVPELDENFVLRLTTAVNAGINDPEGVATISNDDGASLQRVVGDAMFNSSSNVVNVEPVKSHLVVAFPIPASVGQSHSIRDALFAAADAANGSSKPGRDLMSTIPNAYASSGKPGAVAGSFSRSQNLTPSKNSTRSRAVDLAFSVEIDDAFGPDDQMIQDLAMNSFES